MAKRKPPVEVEENNEIPRKTILILIGLSIIAKPVIALITTVFFHSFVDLFDIAYYYKAAVALAQGGTPYISFQFEYPIAAWIPIEIAYIMSGMFRAPDAFALVFQILMTVCDAITTVCVYLIGRKLFTDERFAFNAGILYITSFSAGYFVITKYDAFPTCLMMIGLVLTIYGRELYDEVSDYWMQTLGFFSKIFPILVVPFTVLYNSKGASIKSEAWKAFIPLFICSAILILPIALLKVDTIRTYIPIRTEAYGIYSNTLTFTIYSWLHNVFGANISIDGISASLYVLAAGLFIVCLYIAHHEPKNIRLFLSLVLSALLLVVLSTSVKSPQYVVWFTPLLCLLAADDLLKIGLVYAVQITAFIEFPLAFGVFYTATSYTGIFPTSAWQTALFVFTLEYVVLIVCGWVLVVPREVVPNG